MIKKLPIIYPPINSFPHQGTTFSILYGREECKPWIFSNFIQVFSLKNLSLQGVRGGLIDFFYNSYGDWKQFELKANPWIRFYSIPEEYIYDYKIDIISFIKNAINQNRYLYLSIDRYYIPIYQYSYLKNHADHEMMIYGYDDDNESFFIGDNGEGKYVQSCLSYQILEQSFNSMVKMFQENKDAYYYSEMAIYMLEVRQNGEVNLNSDAYVEEVYNQVNIKKVIHDLKEYLLLDNCADYYNNSDYYVYGIDCYDELQDFLHPITDYTRLDIRAFHSFLQHKKLMVLRLEYLGDTYHVNHLAQLYKDIVNKFESMILMLLKCNAKKDSSYFERVSVLLTYCKENEINIVNNLIEILERSLQR